MDRDNAHQLDSVDGVYVARQTRSRNARDRLLKAGATVFMEIGYDNTKVSDIADAAGCSVGSFYRRFRDKEAFVGALSHQFVTRYRSQTKLFFSLPELQEKSSAEVISIFVKNTIRVFKKNQWLYRIVFQTRLASGGTNIWSEKSGREHTQGEQLAIFLRARGEGRSSDLVGECDFVLRTVESVIFHRLLNPAWRPPDDPVVFDRLVRMVVSYLELDVQSVRKPLKRVSNR